MSVEDRVKYIKEIVLKKECIVIKEISSLFRLSNSSGNKIMHKIVEEDERFKLIKIDSEVNSKSKSKRRQKVLALILKNCDFEKDRAILGEFNKIMSGKPDIQ